jgi:hypothetical protein
MHSRPSVPVPGPYWCSPHGILNDGMLWPPYWTSAVSLPSGGAAYLAKTLTKTLGKTITKRLAKTPSMSSSLTAWGSSPLYIA